MTQKELLGPNASHRQAWKFSQAYDAARQQYIVAAAKYGTSPAEAARLRAEMDAAGQRFSEMFRYSLQLREQLVKTANWEVVEAAHEYCKRKALKHTPPQHDWVRAEIDWATDFVLPVLLVVACYYTLGTSRAMVFAAFAALITAVRVLWRQRSATRFRYELNKNNELCHEKWLKEAADRLNKLAGTPLAAPLMSKDLNARYTSAELTRAHNQVAAHTAEKARAAKRQAGLDAWRDRQDAVATGAAATAVATYAADDSSSHFEPAWEPDQYEFHEPQYVDAYPSTNINGMPMIAGSGIDVSGHVFGDTSFG